uniref:Coiled-coil domain containing 157 n=2 Tax=Podarcis muralis TaxID=64176 RepID=A0A670KIF3_PODMU
MVTLLVNQNYMESLRKDITDLQGTVLSVFTRAGAVRYPSWKFPDKLSCDLDLVALLEHYDFAQNDPEFTHHSHVVLLELVIDRLLLLLQSFTRYTENLTSEQAVPPSRTTGPCMSIGLAVKKYWNSMLKLGSLYQQLASEKKRSREDALGTNASFQEAKAENESLKICFSESDVTLPSFRSSPLTSSASSRLLDGCPATSSEAPPAQGAAKPICSTHCQTIESSLVPCDACERAQLSLREVGSAIIGICNSQNLPSSLSRFLEMVEETLGRKPLTAVDISYWASEQSKDLSRINKHLRKLMELINPLKGELEESEKEKGELKRQLETFDSRLQKEREEREQKRKEAEQAFERRNTENLQMMATLRMGKEDLQKKAAALEQNVSTLKEKLQRQEDTIQGLERAKRELLQELRETKVCKAEVDKLKDQLGVLTSQLESTKQQLNGAITELEKEKAKAESVLRHKESLQTKQMTLMKQLDNLDQECEQLKTSLADREEDQYILKERLKEMQEEKWEIQHQLAAQQKQTERAQKEKLSLEQRVSELQTTVSELKELIEELKDRERLLVLFPDLHIPVEAQYEGTGDVMEDMGKQLQANNIRISILEEENSRLRTAVAKMREAAQQEGPKLVPPTQLWNLSSPQDSGTHTPTRHPARTSAQGAALRPPASPKSPGSPTPHRSKSTRNASKNGSPFRSQQSKPSAGEATRKSAFTFISEEQAIRAHARGKGKSRTPGHSARCNRKHQK